MLFYSLILSLDGLWAASESCLIEPDGELQSNPTKSISPVDRFPIPKVGLSVKWGLWYCPKYDSVCHRGLRSYRSFIEWNDFLRLCTSRGSTLFASLLKREQTPIEVSVSKAHFYTSNSLIFWWKDDQKEFRNDCGACAVLSVHPECQNIFLVTNKIRWRGNGKFSSENFGILNME